MRSYEARIHEILEANYAHLTKLRREWPAALNTRLYSRIWSIGGGHPQLESFIRARTVTVLDPQADRYANLHHVFDEVFRPDAEVEYRNGRIPDHEIATEPGSLITFVHVLEHLELADVAEALAWAGRGPSDVLIYQPNPDASTCSSWFHWSPEHITLIGLGRLLQLMRDSGIQPTVWFPYCDDLFIWARREDSASQFDPKP